METKTKVKSKLQEKLESEYCVILHNDDYNSFEHVIRCLMNICNKSHIVAKTIAFTVHNSGKCEVECGEKDEMKKISQKLNSKNLNSTVEEK